MLEKLKPLLVISFLLILVGCNEPSTEKLLGWTLEQVLERYGEPRFNSQVTMGEPFYGPSPGVLQDGETFLLVTFLADNNYDIYEIMLVSPELYEKYIGEAPGDEDWYVIQVSVMNVDTVC